MKRARVVTLNAALGPLDYRVPDGMAVEPGSIVVAPLGPRQLLGVVWEAGPAADRRSAGCNGCARWPALVDVPPIAAPLRRLSNGPPTIISRRSPRCCGWCCPSSAALEGSRQLIEYRPTGLVPDRLTPQREKALAAIEGRQGTIRELADHAEVSDAVLRGLVNAGALEAVAVDADRPLPCPDPDFAPPDLNDDQRDAAASLAAAIGKGFDPVLLDGVTGSGKTEVYFEAIAECLAPGQAGARPAPRDRADRALPQALRGALRLRAGRLALRTCARRSAAAPGAASPAAKPRSPSARARRCSCPTRTSA